MDRRSKFVGGSYPARQYATYQLHTFTCSASKINGEAIMKHAGIICNLSKQLHKTKQSVKPQMWLLTLTIDTLYTQSISTIKEPVNTWTYFARNLDSFSQRNIMTTS